MRNLLVVKEYLNILKYIIPESEEVLKIHKNGKST